MAPQEPERGGVAHRHRSLSGRPVTLADPMIDLSKRHPEFGTSRDRADSAASPVDSLPEFRYADAGEPTLAELRETFALDSVAGDGESAEGHGLERHPEGSPAVPQVHGQEPVERFWSKP
jgi:hypothetical protein